MSKKKELTAKQKAFVREYLLCRNASEAMRKAGYTSKNPDVDAAKLLVTPSIAALIKENEKEVEKKFNISQEELLQALIEIVAFDPSSVLEWNKGRLVYKPGVALSLMKGADFTIYPEYQTKEDKKEGIIRARLSIQSGDRRGAVELLGKQIGMWGKNVGSGSGDRQAARRDALNRVRAALAKRSGRK